MRTSFVSLQEITPENEAHIKALYAALPYHPQIRDHFSLKEWSDILMADPGASGVLLRGEHPVGVWVTPQDERVWMSASEGASVRALAFHLARTHSDHQWAQVLVPMSTSEEDISDVGWRRRLREEVLSWERRPERGPLHDPPEKWFLLAPEAFWEYHRRWEAESPLWPRSQRVLARLSERVPTVAYGINVRDIAPAGAMILCAADDHMAYIADLIWSPQAGPRNVGRYLLQTLYLYRPTVTPALDMVLVTSGLNRVLMALGYRVYRRWWHEVWERV